MQFLNCGDGGKHFTISLCSTVSIEKNKNKKWGRGQKKEKLLQEMRKKKAFVGGKMGEIFVTWPSFCLVWSRIPSKFSAISVEDAANVAIISVIC